MDDEPMPPLVDMDQIPPLMGEFDGVPLDYDDMPPLVDDDDEFDASADDFEAAVAASLVVDHEESVRCEEGKEQDGSNGEGENYHFVETSHSIQVLSGLNSLRDQQEFCDVTLCVDGEQFLCHKVVLASFSSYFKAMFTGKMAESRQEKVAINGVEAAMIRALVNYAYTSEIIINKDNVQSLLSAANLLEIIPVIDACCQFLERHMDETNCLGIHCFAESHACENLRVRAKKYTLQNFSLVCQQEEYVQLTAKKLIEFISDDDLSVASEEIVFDAVLMWILKEKDEREAELYNILQHVRLPLLSPYFLHDHVEKVSIINKSKRCMKLIEEAKTYHLLQDRRSELRTPRTRPRKSAGTKEVIVAVGGEDDKVVLRSVESYDPVSQHWKTLSCLPFAVSKHGVAVSGSNHLYMCGGEFPDGSASRTMWRYDPCFDSWQELMSMHVPRSELGLAMLDGYVYAVGGWEGTARLDSIERFNIVTNSWSLVPPMKMAVTSPAVVAHDGLLYVTGGAILEDGDGINLVQCFNPRTNKWSELAPMLIARSGSAACVLGGFIYVIGGWHASTENTNKVERYDPRTNTWKLMSPMIERRYRPGVAVLDGRIFVCGGEEGWDRYHDSIECYDEANDKWSLAGELITSRSWHSCVAMTMRKDSYSAHALPDDASIVAALV